MMLELLFWVCIAIVVYTYLGYPVLLAAVRGIFRKNRRIHHETEDLPRVDILIAAFNEEKVIGRRVKNCLELDYPADKLNVWVVSDGSRDLTNEIVRSCAAQDKRIHLIELERTGKSGAINKAILSLTGDLTVFSDANTEFEPQAVKMLVRHFQDTAVGCVCGRLIYRNPGGIMSGKGESLYWRYETLLKKLEGNLGYVCGANGAIYAICRELFETLPPGVINDDFTISMKIVEKGYHCLYEENAIAYEEIAPTMQSEFKRHVRDGAGHYIAVTHLLGLLNPFLGIRSCVYWSHRILRWVVPFVLMGIFWMNALMLDKPFFQAVFTLQCLFYALAVAGLWTAQYKKIPFVFYVPFYFCNLNAALFMGFLKAVFGRQKTAWESTERAI